jgi:hypothetical protein
MSFTTIITWPETIWMALPQVTTLLEFLNAAASFYVSCSLAQRRLRRRPRHDRSGH